MQLSTENDLRPIGEDLLSALEKMYEHRLALKDLIIKNLIEENKQLQEKIKGGI